MPASKSGCGSFSAQNLFQNQSSFLQCPQLKVCPTLAHGHVREDMTQCLLEAVPINQHNTQKKLKIKYQVKIEGLRFLVGGVSFHGSHAEEW
jgi:hypothetical protein